MSEELSSVNQRVIEMEAILADKEQMRGPPGPAGPKGDNGSQGGLYQLPSVYIGCSHSPDPLTVGG